MSQQQFTPVTIGKAVCEADLTIPFVAHVPRTGLSSSLWIDEVTSYGADTERYALLTTIAYLAQQLNEVDRKAIVCTLLDEMNRTKAAEVLTMLTQQFEVHVDGNM